MHVCRPIVQTLVDIEVRDEAVAPAAQRLKAWLIERRIVAAEMTDSVVVRRRIRPPTARELWVRDREFTSRSTPIVDERG